MTKKKTNTIIKHGKKSGKRWQKATNGSTPLRFIGFFMFGVGLVTLAVAIFVYVRSQNVRFTPLPSIAHTNEIPDTGELLRDINIQRKANNRVELEADDKLNKVAEQRLEDMVDSQQYSHKDQNNKYYYDLLSEAGYNSSYSCENLDIEPTTKPDKFIESWLGSTGTHKQCMLSDKVSKIGIASGKFTRDDKSSSDNFLVVTIFAAAEDPPNEKD